MLTLYRTKHTITETLGVICLDGIPLFFTMEPPYKNNQRNVSCIPTGIYRVVPVVHKEFGQTLLITNVSQRDGIYFHCGNKPTDSKGCILVGGDIEAYNETWKCAMLFESRKLFNQYMPSLCQMAPMDLLIINVEPGYGGNRTLNQIASEKV